MPRTVIKQPPPRNKESGDSNNLQQPPCRSQLESTDDNANKGKQRCVHPSKNSAHLPKKTQPSAGKKRGCKSGKKKQQGRMEPTQIGTGRNWENRERGINERHGSGRKTKVRVDRNGRREEEEQGRTTEDRQRPLSELGLMAKEKN
ncbi:hypothetical protein EV2_022306 [Malus domestica]